MDRACEWDDHLAGGIPWANWVSADYDPMGRYGGYVECALTSGLSCEGSSWVTWFPQGYDFAGNLQEATVNICGSCDLDDDLERCLL